MTTCTICGAPDTTREGTRMGYDWRHCGTCGATVGTPVPPTAQYYRGYLAGFTGRDSYRALPAVQVAADGPYERGVRDGGWNAYETAFEKHC